MGECGTCGGGTGDGMHLCAGCTEGLEHDLRDVESTVEAIWASAARLDVGNGSVGSSGHATSPDPTNSRAYDTGRTLNVILTGWANTLGHKQPHAVKAAHVLLEQIREVRKQDWAPVLKQELHDALNDCRTAMDRKPSRITLGRCQGVTDGIRCPDTVTAIDGQAWATCRTCGEEVNVRDHQAWMLSEAWHVQAPLKKIVRALKSAGHLPIPEKRVEKWVERGALVPVKRADGHPPLYTPAAVLAAYRAKEQYKANMAAQIEAKKLGRVA